MSNLCRQAASLSTRFALVLLSACLSLPPAKAQSTGLSVAAGSETGQDSVDVPAVPDQAIWPGPSFLTVSGLQAGLAGPFSTDGSMPGGSLELVLGASALEPLSGWGLNLNLGYRWFTPGSLLPLPLPRTQLSAGLQLEKQLSLGSFWALRPALQLGAGVVNPGTEDTLHFEAAARLGLFVHLKNRSWLLFEPQLRWQPGSAYTWQYGLSFGLRVEQSWLLPLPRSRLQLSGLPLLYSPDDDGYADDFLVELQMEPRRYIGSWELLVLEDSGTVFARLGSGGQPPSNAFSIGWDGWSDDGRLVEPAATYTLVLQTLTVDGRKWQNARSFTVDILVMRQGDKYKVRVPSIVFPANEADLARIDTDWMISRNREILERLLQLFSRFPEYRIIVEGHANSVNWQAPAAFALEQERDLLPLSAARAEAVRQALLALGMEAARLDTAALGGLDPLVPFSDEENSWRNRRVEFLLVRSASE